MTKKTFILFVSLAVIIFIAYLPANQAIFIDDGSMGLNEIKTKGISGYWNAYDAENLYYGQYALQIIFYKLFGTNSILWLLLFALMHALNTILLFQFLKKLAGIFSDNSYTIALGTSLLFLCSPYLAENIVWAATTHYCTTLAFLLYTMNVFINKCINEKRIFRPVLFYLGYVFTLMSLEYAFLFPIVFTLLYVLLKQSNIAISSFKKIATIWIAPMIITIVLYISVLYVFKHAYIPRVGTIHDITFNNPIDIANRYMQGILKILGQSHFWPPFYRTTTYKWLEQGFNGAGILFILVGCIYYLFKITNKQYLPLCLWLAACTFLFYYPILRIYFSYGFQQEHARYTYFPSVFLYTLLVIGLARLPKYFRYCTFIVYLIFSCSNVYKTICQKKDAGKLFATYLKNYPINNYGKNYILNSPSFCNQSLVFWYENRMPTAYHVLYNKNILSQYKEIMGVVYQTPHDSFKVERLNSTTFKLHLITPGDWFMQNGFGGADYSTEDYTCDIDDYGGCVVTFKHLDSNDNVFLFNRLQFEKVN